MAVLVNDSYIVVLQLIPNRANFYVSLLTDWTLVAVFGQPTEPFRGIHWSLVEGVKDNMYAFNSTDNWSEKPCMTLKPTKLVNKVIDSNCDTLFGLI